MSSAHPRGISSGYNGQRYRSKFEAAIAKDLTERKIAFKYEPEKLPYFQASLYIPDLELPSKVFVELKGRLTPQDRRQLLDVRKAHPGLDLRLVFQRASNKLGKGPHSYTYGQWATKHGFLWAEGAVPETWILE